MSSKFQRSSKNPQTCPGLKEFIRPSPKMVTCHTCGADVEIWSDENTAICDECGTEWRKPDEHASCLQYCEYADKCREIIEERKK